MAASFDTYAKYIPLWSAPIRFSSIDGAKSQCKTKHPVVVQYLSLISEMFCI